MKERLLRSFFLLGYGALATVASIAFLIGGYWLSDRVYDAGLWPIGMVMRIFLLFLLAAVVIVPIALVVFVTVSLFRKEWLEEP